MRKSGDVVKINGKEYILGNRIGGGLEGTVFEIDGLPNYVIKLINSSKLSPKEIEETRKRLLWLKESVGSNDELKQKLAVPKGLLDDDLGYVMLKASEHKSLKTYITFPHEEQEFIEWYKANYKLKKRLQIATFMFNALELIHISGLIFTDLSPNNIMVHNEKNNLVFIDTDNMRRRSDAYLGVLGTEGYMAPEIYHYVDKKMLLKMKELNIATSTISSTGKITIDSDIFSAAIIAFQLLTLQHPFVGDVVEEGTAEDETEAYHCKTDYILKNNTENFSSNPFVKMFENEITGTEKLKGLFYRTFVDGKENPAIRPTAIEFYEAFSEAADMLTRCESCGAELLYNIDTENKCWDCSASIQTKTCLQIFSFFDEANRNELVSKIVSDSFVDISKETNNKFLLLSQIVLNEGETKTLYLRHFEKTNKRSLPYATVMLLNSDIGEAEISVKNSSVLTECSLKERKTGRVTPISNTLKAYKFSAYDHIVFFETLDSRLGKIRTIGGFYRGNKI
jgi:serine/threonine protein kinase